MKINTIYNENCIKTMSKMPDCVVDMIITSPPYDGMRKYNGYQFDFNTISKSLVRILKPGGVIIWVVADQVVKGSETGSSFRQILSFNELGLNIHDTMIYAKKNFIPLTHNRYEQGFEYMFCLSKGRPKTFNGIREACKTSGDAYNYSKKGSNIKEGGYRRRNEVVQTKATKLHTNIFFYSTGSSGAGHPAPFPEQLVHDQIISWSNEGDLIYDPFMGCGTSAKVAKQLGRKYIGSEIAKKYWKLSLQRI